MSVHSTKTFKSGNSVAIRLPKAIGIGPDQPMLIEEEGGVLTIRPTVDPAEEKRKLLEMIEKLRALPKPPSIEKREPIEFPDRPGLY